MNFSRFLGSNSSSNSSKKRKARNIRFIFFLRKPLKRKDQMENGIIYQSATPRVTHNKLMSACTAKREISISKLTSINVSHGKRGKENESVDRDGRLCVYVYVGGRLALETSD